MPTRERHFENYASCAGYPDGQANCPTFQRKVLSYPVFMPKPSTHRMYTQYQLFHTYGQKVFTENQMS
jgi:hypothetical protein